MPGILTQVTPCRCLVQCCCHLLRQERNRLSGPFVLFCPSAIDYSIPLRFFLPPGNIWWSFWLSCCYFPAYRGCSVLSPLFHSLSPHVSFLLEGSALLSVASGAWEAVHPSFLCYLSEKLLALKCMRREKSSYFWETSVFSYIDCIHTTKYGNQRPKNTFPIL